MAITEGITGVNQSTAGATEELAYDSSVDGGKFTTFVVRCTSAASNSAVVRVLPMHSLIDAGSGVPIVAGDREYFRVGDGQIEQVYIGGSGGATTVDWGPVASTY